MIAGGSVFKNGKVKKTKFKKKNDSFDNYDRYESDMHKHKHVDKSMYRMMKNERSEYEY